MAKSRRPDTPSSAPPVISLPVLEKVLGSTLAEARDRYDRLTKRERQVADLMARGIPNPVIAEQLGISPKTLDIHRANVMHKLVARTSAMVANVVNLVRLVAATSAG